MSAEAGAPEPVAAPAEDEEPGPEAAGPEKGTTVGKFMTVLRDLEKKREEATVTGKRAVLREQIYDVFAPLLVVNVWPGEDQPLDVQLEKVHVKADRADLDEGHGIVRLFGNVTATGKDSEISTDRVVYNVTERTLASDQPVRIQKDKAGKGGATTPAFVVNGTGMDVDLTLRKMTILKDVQARFYDVSQDFLSAGLDKGTAPSGEPQQVVITSERQMVYEHLARTLTFTGNVQTTSGPKKLWCDQLTVLLGNTQSTDRLEVSDVIGVGNVKLTFQDQTARGQELEWHNVTQTGVLTGSPCVMSTPEFDLTAKELTFYRVNDRFHCEGPGLLLWKAAQKAGPRGEESKGAGALEAGPMRFKDNVPVQVTWTTSMTYHVAARVATFTGDVVVRQESNSLECNQLVLTFEPDGTLIRKFEADGQVDVREPAGGRKQDVASDRLVWDAASDTVEFVAREGEMVSVAAGPHAVSSKHVIMAKDGQSLDCPAAGRLTVAPTAGEAAAGTGQVAKEPLEVDWQKTMQFRQDPRPVAQFAGDATAHRGDQRIRGDALHAEFDAQMNPVKITATGNAFIEVSSEQGTVQRAEVVPGLAATEASCWRLASEELVVSIPQNEISSPMAGSLTVLKGETATSTITWQRSIHLDLAKNVAVFQGNVHADMPDAVLKSDKLTLEFDQDRKLRHMWAEGAVYFSRKEEGAWQLQAGSAEAIFVAAGEMRQVIARDKVEVRDQKRVLNAAVLQLFFEKAEGEPQAALTRAVGQDEVRIKYLQEERLEGGGDRLEWDRKSDTYVLTGAPEAFLRRGGLMVLNDKILVDRPSGRMTLPPGARPVKTVVNPDGR